MKTYKLNANLSGKLDRDKGAIRDVSLISEGPALGHGVDIDTKTLSGLFELTKGKPLTAHWTHGDMFTGDRLGTEVGLFAAPYIDGKQLKAHFRVLEAFRKAYPERFAYLFELAEKAPENFGVSIHFEGRAVWLLDTGAEVEAEDERPASAVGEQPRVRVDRIISADFVSEPAANAGGLFARGKLTELLDARQKWIAETTEFAAKLTAADETAKTKDATIAELSTKHDQVAATLAQERTAFATKETEFAAQKTALEARVTEFAAQVDSLSRVIADQKSAAEAAKAEYDAQLSAYHKTLLEFGAIPHQITGPAQLDYWATYSAMPSSPDKTHFFRQHRAEIEAAFAARSRA